MNKKLGLLGRKVGMTQLYDKEGRVVPVTAIEAGPCSVLAVKSPEKDGYGALQIGFEKVKEGRASKPAAGYFKKAGVSPLRHLRELRLENAGEFKVGQELKVDIFSPGDYVDITGQSIGKGFQGGMKRWHWKGGKETHGSTSHRRIGSIGSSSDPSRVFRGHHLPGRMGGDQVTVQNLEVVHVDLEKNLIAVKGGVPGPDGNLLLVRKGLKKLKRIEVVKAAPKKEKKVAEKAKKPAAKPGVAPAKK